MRNNVTPHDLAFIGMAMAGLLGLSWLLAGRRIIDKPASSTLPQTFVASRLIPAVGIVFATGGLGICLMMAVTLILTPAQDIGPLWFYVLVASFVFLFGALCAFGIKLFAVWTIWPDRLCLTEDGISARLQGRDRHWSWDMIADAHVLNVGKGEGMLQLILKEPDPEQVRRLRRFPWGKKADPRIIWLEDLWKPTALLTSGDMAVRNAILAVLKSRGRLSVGQSQI